MLTRHAIGKDFIDDSHMTAHRVQTKRRENLPARVHALAAVAREALPTSVRPRWQPVQIFADLRARRSDMDRKWEERSMKVPTIGAVLYLLTAALLAGCGGGNYNGSATGDGSGSSGSNGAGTTTGGTGGGGSSGTGFATPQAFFQADVEPNLGFCRTCHVPGGVADTSGTSVATQGNLFLLSSDSSQDYDNLMASWTRLGKGVTDNKLHTYPSVPAQSHTGGQPWPVGSAPYLAMQTLLSCWDNPSGCAALIGGGDSTGNGGSGGTSGGTTTFPLLGSSHGGHLWGDYCEGKPDSAALPADPRSLIQPGVNQGKAVNFNTYWRSCANLNPAPTTCGQYRQQVLAGATLMQGQGMVGAATFLGGDTSDSLFAIPNDAFNKVWRRWGLNSRPAQFDQLVAERYGSALSPSRNPYPLSGEDPNSSNGGSGQLPLIFTQVRKADGSWTGKIGIKGCNICHSGQVGSAADGAGLGVQYGGAGSIGDFSVLLRDFDGVGSLLPALITKSRGTGAIDQFQLGYLLFSKGNPALLANPKILFSGAIGTIKSPNFWNMGHRPQKFHGAVLPMDANRIDMAEYYPFQDFLQGKDPTDWVDAHDRSAQTWAESLSSPTYPGPINTALAEQGAILFHSKDLWAPNLNNPVPKPAGGNGSCASCHGAYSPRFVNDPSYLDSPALEGIAADDVPMNVIGSDPVYINSMQSLKDPDGGYNQASAKNDFLYCGIGALGDSQTPGMLAPPLYGVWAAAPYLHNGSVPTVWEVLKPSDRHDIWRRVSSPAPAGLENKVVMGYDTNLQRAYDPVHLGWRYDVVQCGDNGTTPFVNCNKDPADAPVNVQQWLGDLYSKIGLLWLIPLPNELLLSQQQIEGRKVYNTHLYSQSNQGHEFTAVLTDAERAALIEYLKTL